MCLLFAMAKFEWWIMDMCGMGIRDVDVFDDTLLNVVEVDGDVVDVIWSAEVAIRQCLHVSTLLLKGITWVVSAHYMFCPRGCWLAINIYPGGFVGEDKLSSEVCALSSLLSAIWCFSWGILYIYKYYLKHSYISNSHKYLNISCISIHDISEYKILF